MNANTMAATFFNKQSPDTRITAAQAHVNAAGQTEKAKWPRANGHIVANAFIGGISGNVQLANV